MSTIDDVATKLGRYFSHTSGPSYVRLMDTPRHLGPAVRARGDAQGLGAPGAIRAQHGGDHAEGQVSVRPRLAELPGPQLGAGDARRDGHGTDRIWGLSRPTQFRFMFGQTPMYPITEPPNYTDFKGAVIRFIRLREAFWERTPEIWFGRFYRLQAGVLSSLLSKLPRLFPESLIDSDDTKMTWNHAKIVVADGAEAMVGGHNLNMDLFRSYPPVHDASVVVHGDAACGAQLFLDRMWACKTDLLTKEYVDINKRVWRNGDDDLAPCADPSIRSPIRRRPTTCGSASEAWSRCISRAGSRAPNHPLPCLRPPHRRTTSGSGTCRPSTN